MRVLLFSLMLVLAPQLAFASAKPSHEEARKVVDYYFHGKGMGPVLLDAKICRDVQREGDEKNECADELTSQAIKKGESIYVWMAYMLPQGDEPQNIIVQFENGGVTRMVKNHQVTGQLRYRTWQKVTLDKVGAWKVKIVHDNGSSTDVLGTIEATVE